MQPIPLRLIDNVIQNKVGRNLPDLSTTIKAKALDIFFVRGFFIANILGIPHHPGKILVIPAILKPETEQTLPQGQYFLFSINLYNLNNTMIKNLPQPSSDL